jgi:hypothetical protein
MKATKECDNLSISLVLLLLGHLLVALLGLFKFILEEVGVLRVGETDGESFLSGFTLRDISGNIPDPGTVGSNVGRQAHLRSDSVVGADLVGLITTHQQTNFLGGLVLQELDITDTTFLPLLQTLVITEELSTPADGQESKINKK